MLDGFKKIIKMKTGGSVTNVYEAKKSSGDKDNIQKTKAIKAGPAAAPSKAAVKSKDFGAKTVGASGHKDPYIKSKESGKTADFPSAAVKGRNKKEAGTVNKYKKGGNVKKMQVGGMSGALLGGGGYLTPAQERTLKAVKTGNYRSSDDDNMNYAQPAPSSSSVKLPSLGPANNFPSKEAYEKAGSPAPKKKGGKIKGKC